jgi:(E)-benzylidenesuccinyl-CoA hydratase
MIDYAKAGHVVTITLNRPERMNAVGRQAMADLLECWKRFRDDDDARVAILTGAGDRSFCAGADLKEMAANSAEPAAIRRDRGRYAGVGNALEDGFPLWKPVIAAINGYCIGEGLVLVLGADIRICSENASFALTEVKRGLNTITGAIRLPKVVPPSTAAFMALTGEAIGAREALRVGLVTSVHRQADLGAAANSIAATIAANAPLAVQAVKETMVRGQNSPFDAAFATGGLLRQLILASADLREGLSAFAERRPPSYTGR